MKIDEDFVKGVAYYIGDGRMSAKRNLSTINQDKEVLKFFIRWLEKYFNIKRENMKIHIKMINPNYIESEVKKDFSKKLSINEKFITSVGLKSQAKPNHNIIVDISAHNAKAKRKFDSLIHPIKNKSLKNKKLALAYLKGIMAAEGSPKYNIKSGSRSIHLKMKNEEEIKYIGRLLNETLGITASVLKVKCEEGMWLITISGFYELTKLNNFNLFEIEGRKKEKFNNMIKSYKRVQTKKGQVSKFFISNLKHHNKKLKKRLTAPELAKLIKRDRTRTIKVLRGLENQKIIKSKRRNSTGRPFEFWTED